MRRLFGMALVAAPFLFIIGMMLRRYGLEQTLLIWVLTAIHVGAIVGGIYLLVNK